jgi:hypothetical protein
MKIPTYPPRTGSFNMAGAIFIAALLATAAFFIWDVSKQQPPPSSAPTSAPPTPTPEQVILAVVSKDPVSAIELATVCDKFPEQTNKLLRDKKMTISGTIKKLWIRGSQDIDIVIDVAGSPMRVVTIYSDFSKYLRRVGSRGGQMFKFQKIGSEAVLMRREGNFWTPGSVSFRETAEVKLPCVFEKVDPASIKLLLPTLPGA